MTACPQCGTLNEDDSKNCQSCRVNLYWAFQHYEELAALCQANNLTAKPETAPFLVETSRKIDAGPTAGWLRKRAAPCRCPAPAQLNCGEALVGNTKSD